MNTVERKMHWENIFQTKDLQEVSWYQPIPRTSLDFIDLLELPKTAKIIDVGAGDSQLVDYLLEHGYEDITVLDISENAIARAKYRLAEKAGQVKWIVADAADFLPHEKYDFWHDRAAFHFLTDEEDIKSYVTNLRQFIQPGGTVLLGTFSLEGPEKCSGIGVKQYSEKSMGERLGPDFQKVKCLQVNHQTPSGKLQNFIFCAFRRK